MNIRHSLATSLRQTTADEVFHQLRSDIIAMRLTPGSKISEVEIAKQYDVSRQPVREAFMRLGDLNLLEIRPQRATLVRKISMQDLNNTRFLRAAIEVEVVREACKVADEEALKAIDKNLIYQRATVDANDAAMLKSLDYEFHQLICAAANRLPAFKAIAENKSYTERVCMLELADPESMIETFEGHIAIIDAIKDRDEERAVRMTRLHLAHLDTTLSEAPAKFPHYFED